MNKVMEKVYNLMGKMAIRIAADTCNEASMNDFYQPPVPEEVLKMTSRNE